MRTLVSLLFFASLAVSAAPAFGLVDDLGSSQTQPAASLVGPFDVTDGHASFLQVSNLAGEDVATHWVFWSDTCDHLVNVWICLTPADTVVVDPRDLSGLDGDNERVGPQVDLSGARGSAIVTAYEAGENCRPSSSAALRDDAIVGSFTVADTSTDAAFGGNLVGFGLDSTETFVDLPDTELEHLDVQTFDPSGLADTTVVLVALRESSAEPVPLRGVSSQTLFIDSNEIPTSLPDVAVSCSTLGPIFETLLPTSITPNSSGIVRLLHPQTSLGPIGYETWLLGFYGQAVGDYGSGSRMKYPVRTPTPAPTGTPIVLPPPTFVPPLP